MSLAVPGGVGGVTPGQFGYEVVLVDGTTYIIDI